MRIIRQLEELDQVERLVVLGNFDGVHSAHQQLFQEAARTADAQKMRSSAIVFEPHPRQFFQPDSPLKLLSLADERAKRIEACGIQELIVLPFNNAVAQWSPKRFVHEILLRALVKQAHVGQNYHFGYRGVGDTDTLHQLGVEYGFSVRVMPLLHMHGAIVSSSQIRKYLHQGNVADAALMLGYPYTLSGAVIHGEQIGRTIGYPTANIDVSEDKLLPRFGVYSGTLDIDNQSYLSLVNIGIRPTVQGASPTVEAYIRDFDGEVYGQTLAVALKHFIRPEQQFASLDQLKNQIARDLETMSET